MRIGCRFCRKTGDPPMTRFAGALKPEDKDRQKAFSARIEGTTAAMQTLRSIIVTSLDKSVTAAAAGLICWARILLPPVK